MTVYVNLYGGLERYSQEDKRKNNLVEITEGTTILQVLRLLKIPEEEVKIIMVNGLHASPNDKLSNNDELSLFPMLFGG